MLVLTRRIGQSIVINDDVVVTVLLFTPRYIELSVATLGGTRLGTRTISAHDSARLPHNVVAVMVNADGEQARIGLEYPATVRIARKENWDELHNTGSE